MAIFLIPGAIAVIYSLLILWYLSRIAVAVEKNSRRNDRLMEMREKEHAARMTMHCNPPNQSQD